MSKYLNRVAVIPILAISVSIASAQGLTLKDRSVIELNAGLWGGAKVSNSIGSTGIQSSASATSFLGGVSYAYGLREDVAVTLSVSILSASSNNVANSFNTFSMIPEQSVASAVVPVLVGVRYYVPNPRPGEKVRPFVSLGVGPYIGTQSSRSIGITIAQESLTESVFGGRVGVGLDLYTGNNFKFVVKAGYNFMSDFSQPIGARTNYNGGDLSIGIGYAI